LQMFPSAGAEPTFPVILPARQRRTAAIGNVP